MRPSRRRPHPLVLLFALVLFGPILVGLGGAVYECKMYSGGGSAPRPPAPPGADAAQAAAGSLTYLRPEDQTYLTFPEWYIVYSADEYAGFIASRRPSAFPYFEAVRQYWQGYYDVCGVTRDRYPFNADDHTMLAVIGASFTAENVFKGIYENTIGRASEWTASGGVTPEEAYGRQVAAEYGTFIHTVPWYSFPFWSKLRPLWDMPLGNPNVVRRVERRFALSMEYALKGGYGWAIEKATESAYAPEDQEILARAEGVTPELAQHEPGLRIVQAGENGAALVALPRYEAFTQLVPRLLGQGVRFTEIAGNHEIMVTVLAPSDWRYSPPEGAVLFSLPVPSQPSRSRFALQVPVGSLQTVVDDVARPTPTGSVVLEHIYDY